MQKNTNECNIHYIALVCVFLYNTGACCTSMYSISDLLHLLHLRNAILIGKQKNSLLVKLQKRAI